jgi:hypothetical protein
VVGKILDKEQYNYGFDAQNGEYGNLMTKGIIDPAKVVRCALQDAASIAGLLITTEAMVAEMPKKESPAMPGAVWVEWAEWTTDRAIDHKARPFLARRRQCQRRPGHRQSFLRRFRGACAARRRPGRRGRGTLAPARQEKPARKLWRLALKGDAAVRLIAR